MRSFVPDPPPELIENSLPSLFRKGLYPINSFPSALGSEAAGEIVALPTDEKVLNDEEFKLRKFAVGGKAAVVRPPSHLLSLPP